MEKFSSDDIAQVAVRLKNWTIIPAGTEGYAKAEVMVGGVWVVEAQRHREEDAARAEYVEVMQRMLAS